MTTLPVAGLMVDNVRSRAYLQYLVRAGLRLRILIVQDVPGAPAPGGTTVVTRRFDPSAALVTTAEAAGIPVVRVCAASPNDAAVCEAVAALEERDVVYSGPAGVIARDLLKTGKRLIHVHSGSPPAFRGSTTLYYELLMTGQCAATAIAMAPQIDAGPVLHSAVFPRPQAEDLDYVYDAHCRASVLVELMQRCDEHGAPLGRVQPSGDGGPFYVMHPALRAVARSAVGLDPMPTAALREEVEGRA